MKLIKKRKFKFGSFGDGLKGDMCLQNKMMMIIIINIKLLKKENLNLDDLEMD